MYSAPARPRQRPSRRRRTLQFNWLDGHTSGIYSWEYLRRHCQCQECKFAASKPPARQNWGALPRAAGSQKFFRNFRIGRGFDPFITAM
jgi:hypothetical protein